LVRNHLKHGMITVRPERAVPAVAMQGHGGPGMDGDMPKGHEMGKAAAPAAERRRPSVPLMAALSFVALGAGLVIAQLAGPA
jgi:hypothetical protein